MDPQLTGDVPVSVLQSVEVVHELLYGDPEGLKQTCVLKEPIGNLRHKRGPSSLLRAKKHLALNPPIYLSVCTNYI